MNGGSWEYAVGTPENKINNYSNFKGIKGDAVFEISTTGDNSTSWHSDYSCIPWDVQPVFFRGRSVTMMTQAQVFFLLVTLKVCPTSLVVLEW